MKKLYDIKIYYDGDCDFCFKTVRLIKSLLQLPHARTLPAQSDKNIYKEMEAQNSWIVQINDEKYYRYDGILQLVKFSKLSLFYVPLYLLKPIGDLIYERVARARGCK